MDKKIITKQINELMVLKSLSDAYAQISSSRMKRTRDSVIRSREFLAEVQEVFRELQESYRREILSLARKKGLKKGEKLTFLSHNGRSVAVFLGTNAGFYGNLTRNVFNLFAQEVREKNMEATIVGRLGLSMFLEAFPDKSYSYFELPDYGYDRDQMAELIRHLVQYEEIRIYYGKFKSIIHQSPEMTVISAETIMNQEKTKEVTKYLFEPNLEEILMFFETEMFSSVFEQVLDESKLAKFASRMLAMDEAGQKIGQNLSRARLEYSRAVHGVYNKKQLEYLSSIMGGGAFHAKI
jgi:ATP synthase F1 gamma subunit